MFLSWLTSLTIPFTVCGAVPANVIGSDLSLAIVTIMEIRVTQLEVVLRRQDFVVAIVSSLCGGIWQVACCGMLLLLLASCGLHNRSSERKQEKNPPFCSYSLSVTLSGSFGISKRIKFKGKN